MTTLKPLAALLDSSDIRLVLLVLNRPLLPDVNILKKLWSKSIFRVCVDGGSNRLYDCLGEERQSYIPNIITGDFDSAQTEVLDYYKTKGTELIRTQDQDYTDFTKCLRVTTEKVQEMQFDYIAVIGAFGGRMDHVFGNINSLFYAHHMTQKPVLLYSEGSVACLLHKGKHSIQVDTGQEDDWCGLIPVGGACDHVTTTGLKWNLDNQQLKFGGLFSSSNTYDGACEVTVETDQPLLWIMGYKG